MLNNIILGRFILRNSFVHYLSLFINLVAIFIFLLMTKISIKTYINNIKFILFIALFTVILNMFYAKGTPIFVLGPIVITDEGFRNSIFVAVRLVMLILISELLTFTTSPTDLTDALESLLKPLSLFNIKTHEIAMMMTIALRFIPTLLEETNKIMDAQKARGANMETGKFLNRIKAFIPVLIPLFVSSIKRAYDLALAMESRCYRGGEGRTRMKILHINLCDIFAIIIVLSIFAMVLLSNFFVPVVNL